MGVIVLATRLHDRKDFSNAVGLGQAATEYDPKGKAAAELRAAFDEVKRLSELSGGRREQAKAESAGDVRCARAPGRTGAGVGRVTGRGEEGQPSGQEACADPYSRDHAQGSAAPGARGRNPRSRRSRSSCCGSSWSRRATRSTPPSRGDTGRNVRG